MFARSPSRSQTHWSALLLFVLSWSALAGEATVTSGVGNWEPFNLGDVHTDDLPEMRRRKQIRVLVSFSKTDFFIWKGEPRGFETELLERYELFLNEGVEREDEKIRIVYIPVPFSELLPSLTAGLGDLAAAGLTITSARKETVAFTEPYLPVVDEVVVAKPDGPALNSLLDLAGRRVHVLRGSSYAQHLREISSWLASQGHEAITVVEVDDSLSDTDVLELVNAGVFELTVIDNHVADIWSQVLTDMVIHDQVKVNQGGQIAWAVRPENPLFKQNLDEFVRSARKGTWLGNILFSRYFENTYFLKNPLTKSVRRRLADYTALFKEYAERYHLDWLAVAAQAYQESGFNHDLVSPRGAVGVMQLMPSTAADPNVGIDDIGDVANNIHAAAKYLAFLRDRYYDDSLIPQADRWGFMWAAYNAGPESVRLMRERAGAMGLDPNRWFFNVEHAVQRVAGAETVRHVANVHKYYIAYRLSEELLERRATELEALDSQLDGAED